MGFIGSGRLRVGWRRRGKLKVGKLKVQKGDGWRRLLWIDEGCAWIRNQVLTGMLLRKRKKIFVVATVAHSVKAEVLLPNGAMRSNIGSGQPKKGIYVLNFISALVMTMRGNSQELAFSNALVPASRRYGTRCGTVQFWVRMPRR